MRIAIVLGDDHEYIGRVQLPDDCHVIEVKGEVYYDTTPYRRVGIFGVAHAQREVELKR